MRIYDKEGKEINAVSIDRENESLFYKGMVFSPNRKLVLLVFKGKERHRFVVFNEKGEIISEFTKVADTGMRDLSISDDGQIIFRGRYGNKKWHDTLRILKLNGDMLYRFDEDHIVGLYVSYNGKHVATYIRREGNIDLKILSDNYSNWDLVASGRFFGVMVDNNGGIFHWLVKKNSPDPHIFYYSYEGKTQKISEGNYRAVGNIGYDHFRDLWGKGFFILGDSMGGEWEDYVSFSSERPIYGRINIYRLGR